jgi:hypothetical protein
MNRIYRKLLRTFLGKPTKKLTWSVKDFNIAKSYAKRLDHPYSPSKSLWNYLNTPWNDSVDILHHVNGIIETHQK